LIQLAVIARHIDRARGFAFGKSFAICKPSYHVFQAGASLVGHAGCKQNGISLFFIRAQSQFSAGYIQKSGERANRAERAKRTPRMEFGAHFIIFRAMYARILDEGRICERFVFDKSFDGLALPVYRTD
jgi:hypothetical protein